MGICPECLVLAGFLTETRVDACRRGRFSAPRIADLAPHFPQLEFLGFVGQGGMGAIYKARQKELDRIVALKILPPDIEGNAGFPNRFAREAKALAKLNHPGIVTIHEFGRAGGLYFFLMEFVDGLNLRQALVPGRMAPREALAIVAQICDALQYAHDHGIVHRDIKPENVLMDRSGRVKVADFGLVQIIGDAGQASGSGSTELTGATALSAAGKLIGTPKYMSPEQLRAPGEVDHRADIYALGVVFYELLTGELPGKPLQPPSRKVRLDARLDAVVLRALEPQAELRYQQASALQAQLEAVVSHPLTPVPLRQGWKRKIRSSLKQWGAQLDVLQAKAGNWFSAKRLAWLLPFFGVFYFVYPPFRHTSEIWQPTYYGYSHPLRSLKVPQGPLRRPAQAPPSFRQIAAPAGEAVVLSGMNSAPGAANTVACYGAVMAQLLWASGSNLVVTVPPPETNAPGQVNESRWEAMAAELFSPTALGGAGLETTAVPTPASWGPHRTPYRVIFADLDGDGKSDLVVDYYDQQGVWVYHNIGSKGPYAPPTFAPPVILDTGTAGGRRGLAVMDWDRDGRLDIVTADWGRLTFTVFRNETLPGMLTRDSFATPFDTPINISAPSIWWPF